MGWKVEYRKEVSLSQFQSLGLIYYEKKAQENEKKEKKNNISEVINKIILHRKPFSTTEV